MKTEYIVLILGALLLFDILVMILRASFVNTHLPRLLNLRQQNESKVDQVLALLERPRVRISLRLMHYLLIFLISATVFWLSFTLTETSQFKLGYQLLISVGVALILFFIEISVEGWVLKDPEAWALKTGGVAKGVDFLLQPLSWLAIHLMGQTEKGLQQITAPTDDELKTWVEQGQVDGALEKEERQMIYSIFRFGDTLAREIMIPRLDMLALDVQTSIPDALNVLVESGHSRIPIYEDTVDNIIGLLYAKDLLKYLQDPEHAPSLRDILRPVYFIPEAKKLDDLLTELQTRRIHMAIVVDEYGGVAGLVTLEDIIEEIIGEVQDEYDQGEELPYTQISAEECVFKGSIDLDDFNEVMGTSLPKENTETLGGFMYSEIGRVPTGGEEIRVDRLKLVVEQVIGRRILKIRATRLPPENIDEEPSI